MSTSKSFLSQEHRHRSVNPSHRLLLCSPRSRLARGEGCCNRGERCWRLPLRFNSPTPGAVSQCARVSSGSQLCTRVGHASRRQAGDLRPQHRADSLAADTALSGSGPRHIKAPSWGGSPGQRHPSSHTHRRRGDRCPGPPGPAAHERPPPRAPPVGPTRADARARPRAAGAPPGSQGVPGQGGPKAAADGSFTGGWAPRRRCRCFRSPARSARAPGPCPEPRRSPPSWLEAEAPAGRARRRADRRSERQVAQARRGSAGRGLRGGAGPVWVGRRGWGPPLGRARPWGGSADCGGGGDRARGSVFPRAPPLVM